MMRCFLLLVVFGNALLGEAELFDSKTPFTYEGLSQVVYFQKDIISGAKPEGSDGFVSLKLLNVHTIICVDGVVPDVKTAKLNGIKTVHLPLKYVAPSDEQIFDLATVVVRGRKHGNVYIHCHQGKHRSAAAAAIVSIALGNLTLEEATERMLVSETSHAYEGLWNAVEQTKGIDVSVLLSNGKVYPSAIAPEGMTNLMIALDEVFDNLQGIQHAHWQSPKEHPDLVGASEAGVIADIFRTIQLNKETNDFSTDFETQVVNAIHQASGLEEALLQNLPEIELNAYWQRVEQSCIDCHAKFRK